MVRPCAVYHGRKFTLIEATTYFFSGVNMLMSLAALVVAVWLLITAVGDLSYQFCQKPRRGFYAVDQFMSTMVALGGVLLLFFTLLMLVFSSLLIIGIMQRKPSYLKAYLVFGILLTIAILTVTVFYVVAESESQNVNYTSVAYSLLFCGCYVVGLVLVFLTYRYFVSTDMEMMKQVQFTLHTIEEDTISKHGSSLIKMPAEMCEY